MNEIIVIYYIGLLIFALNGLQLCALRAKKFEEAAREERLRRLLMRNKVRRIK